MTLKSRPWLQFDVQVDQVDGNWLVRHIVYVTASPDPNSKPVRCHEIQLISEIHGQRRTRVFNDIDSAAQILPSFEGPYRHSSLQVIIKQSADAVRERVLVEHIYNMKLEGAQPLEAFPTELDALKYIASNKDLCERIGIDVEAARDHFRRHGMFENRKATFDPLVYLASYDDLSELEIDEIVACHHYIKNGWREGRLEGSFEPLHYLASNIESGLAKRIGLDPAAAARHYLEHGRMAGLPTDTFDLHAYRQLTASVDGLSNREALRHFLEQLG